MKKHKVRRRDPPLKVSLPFDEAMRRVVHVKPPGGHGKVHRLKRKPAHRKAG